MTKNNTAYKFTANNKLADLSIIAKKYNVTETQIFNASTADERRDYAKKRAKMVKSLSNTKEASRFRAFEDLFAKLQPVSAADEIALFRKKDLNAVGEAVAKHLTELDDKRKAREAAKKASEARANARSEAKKALLEAMKKLTGKNGEAVKAAFANLESI